MVSKLLLEESSVMMAIREVAMDVVIRDVTMRDYIIAIRHMIIHNDLHGRVVQHWVMLVMHADEMGCVLADVLHDQITHMYLVRMLVNATMAPVILWKCV